MQCPHCGVPGNPRDRFCASCGQSVERETPSSPGDPLIGRTVGGAYLLQDLLGVGGMGRVYRGVQTALGRTVAVKVIHPNLLNDEQTVARFYNEAKAASRLNHPDSVGVIDFGRSEDGVLYLVMEYLSGKDLATVIAEEGPLPFPRIVKILRRMAGALGEAHALGVIHRDLKPENVLVQRSRRGGDTVKIVDFGLATITGPQSTSVTTPGLVCGTPDYMSPEQGRGDPLDGRTDLYSLGVLFFELLTDRLPYIDDTPTKVVMRHIHDPIPDPRVTAPGRNIPDFLAAIAMKALQKSAGDRYQSADEFDEALKRAETELERASASIDEVRCRECNTPNPRTSRFCSGCGAKLALLSAAPTSTSDVGRPSQPEGRSTTAPPLNRLPLLGRSTEMEQFIAIRAKSTYSVSWLRLVGDPGIGKTRLMHEMASRSESMADVVVHAGPHPSLAHVPYHAIKTLVSALRGVEFSRIEDAARMTSFDSPLARAGLKELQDPRGLVGLPGVSRAAAVGAALATALRVANRDRQIVVFVDDLHRCDALTLLALNAVLDEHLPGVLLVTAQSVGARMPDAHVRSTALALTGLGDEDALIALRGGEPGLPSPPPSGRFFLPLYIEQLQGLGYTSLDDENAPQRLADAVISRVSRLDLRSRKLLQALTVIGERADIETLRTLAPQGDLGPMDKLLRIGVLKMIDGDVAISHPFVRELVEASIPSEARKELHGRALALASTANAPIEIRAEHAYRAGEPMSAILVLERAGDLAMARGDSFAATVSYRKGLEVARRESFHAGDTMLDPAVVTLSRKLGEALDHSGDHAGADGVLREAMDFVGPASRERARMLLELGRVSIHRERQRDAMRLLGQAIEIGTSTRDGRCAAEARLELGLLRSAAGDFATASTTLESALDVLENEQNADGLLARASLALADIALERRDPDSAGSHLFVALARARAMGSGAILARVSSARARLESLRGNTAGAATLKADAMALAGEAGDALFLRTLQSQ